LAKQKLSTDDDFFNNIALLIESARRNVAKTVDSVMSYTYFEIGRIIVEKEQHGKERAEYGRGLLKELSEFLTARFDRGFSVTNLKSFRKFYLEYAPQIEEPQKGQMPSAKSKKAAQIGRMPSALLPRNQQIPSIVFPLGWSHYQVLMRISGQNERKFYEIESFEQQWSRAKFFC
jgi:hypothetical protein